jgi:hypothetical protein
MALRNVVPLSRERPNRTSVWTELTSSNSPNAARRLQRLLASRLCGLPFIHGSQPAPEKCLRKVEGTCGSTRRQQ